jgi:glycine/D-amino acid oxidase-like deaminating enzyme
MSLKRSDHSPLSRRHFLASASALGVTTSGFKAFGANKQSEKNESLQILECSAPVIRRVDVLVCGGGPAGCAAAVYAARSGAKTMLLENMPFLGGVWTAVGVSHYMQGHVFDGFNSELQRRLPIHKVFGRHIYILEEMKRELDLLTQESGVEVQLHTRAVGVAKQGRRLSGVFTASKSGFEFIEADVVIDATGDGDVSAAAGCEYEMGRDYDGKTQPVTLFATIGGYRGEPAKRGPLLEILAKGGVKPSYPNITLFPQPGQEGIFRLMATQFYGVDGTDVREMSEAERKGREEIQRYVEIFKKYGGDDWNDVFLISTGPAIGVRATRRIRGRYYLTWKDMDRGARFNDGITKITSGSGIHSVDDPYDPPPAGVPRRPEFRVRAYEIPFRSLQAEEYDNLLMAGRCISGDHYALGSYRLTGNVVRTGEAAGVAAAMSAIDKILPSELAPEKLVGCLSAMRKNS